MRASNLPSLHKFIDNGFQLRTEAAKAISRVEIYKGKSSDGEAPAGPVLAGFFQACMNAASGVSTSAIVTDGQVLTIGGDQYTFTVVDGEITLIETEAV